MKFIFKEIKEDLKEYSVEFTDKKLEKKTKEQLEKYFSFEEGEDEEANIVVDKKIINKYNLTGALKWFMTLVLFNEKDKKNKIKGNKKNLMNYLNVADLWDKSIYKDDNFKFDLAQLKKCNIQINKIIWLYDFLVEEEEDDDEETEKEIKDYIEKNYSKQDENENEKGIKNGDEESEKSDDSESNDGNDSGSNDGCEEPD